MLNSTNIEKITELKALLFLALLLVPSLVIGPLISEIIIFFLLVIYLYSISHNKYLLVLPQKNFIIFIILFLIYINLNTFFNSETINLSLKNSVFYFRFFFYSIIFFTLIHFYKEKFFKLYLFFALPLLIFFLIDLSCLIIFKFSISGNSFVTQRFSSIFGEELVMGGYIMKILPSLLICLTYLKKNNFYFILTFCLSGLLILSSGERTSFGHFAIFSFLLFINKNYFKRIFIMGIIFSCIFSFLYFIKFYPVNRIVSATIAEFKIDGRSDLILFSDVHENMLLTSYEIFKNNPIFGTGIKSYRVLCSDDKYSSKVKKKIINENNLIAKNDGYLFLTKKNITHSVTLKPYNQYIAYIFYDNGEELEYNLFRYRRDIGAVKKGEILENAKELFPKVYFSKGDLIARMMYDRIDGCDTHPHNIFAQLAAELGIVGIIFFLIFYGYLLRELFKISWKNSSNYLNCYYLSICSLIINFLPFFPSGNLFNNWYSILLYIPFGFFMYFNYLKIQKNI